MSKWHGNNLHSSSKQTDINIYTKKKNEFYHINYVLSCYCHSIYRPTAGDLWFVYDRHIISEKHAQHSTQTFFRIRSIYSKRNVSNYRIKSFCVTNRFRFSARSLHVDDKAGGNNRSRCRQNIFRKFTPKIHRHIGVDGRLGSAFGECTTTTVGITRASDTTPNGFCIHEKWRTTDKTNEKIIEHWRPYRFSMLTAEAKTLSMCSKRYRRVT